MMHPNMAYSPANNALNDSLANLNLSPAQSADRSIAKVRRGSADAQYSAKRHLLRRIETEPAIYSQNDTATLFRTSLAHARCALPKHGAF